MFCQPNATLNEVWLNDATSECFIGTFTSLLVSMVFIIIFGTPQLLTYYKSGDFLKTTRKSFFLYYLQNFILYFLSVLSICRFLLQITFLIPGAGYGYSFLWTAVNFIVYTYSAVLLWFECNYNRFSSVKKGHSYILVLFWTICFITENITLFNLGRAEWLLHKITFSDKVEISFFVSRYVSCLLLFVLGFYAPGVGDLEENSIESTEKDCDKNDENSGLWKRKWNQFLKLLSFLWPKSNLRLQIKFMFCVVLCLSGRVLNAMGPLSRKYVVDSMTITTLDFRWDLVVMSAAIEELCGIFRDVESYLWFDIERHTRNEVQVSLFQHLHSLSLKWHVKQKTGEVIQVMERSSYTVTGIARFIFLDIGPGVIDICVAITYLATTFNFWFAIIIFVTIIIYSVVSAIATEMAEKFERSAVNADDDAEAHSVDSLLNFETVKYYGTEEYEVTSLREALAQSQERRRKSNLTWELSNFVKNKVMAGGVLAGSLLCLHMVTVTGELTPGDYVFFSSYISQIFRPISWISSSFWYIQTCLVDMEKVFQLLSEEPDITDIPGALPLTTTEGEIEFKNVSFSYDKERSVLQNISFVVPGGKTVALVGPSGSGKTSITKLLFRFYDVDEGAIFIDGQNIKNVRQTSIRRAIGVVPQDVTLFNNTVKFNIRYGRINASDEDIMEAAKAADIHDKIVTFPEGYDTVVGERGTKLSGGEKQRVAIARTILKSPSIVLLDEATSALDTHTERNIQMALKEVCVNKTTLIIAHRLSTIIHADEILVLKDGKIIERGRHNDLINTSGTYASMWQQQLKNDLSE